jgi:hypothetical protein
MIPHFSVGSSQIIFAIYGAYSYVLKLCGLKTNLDKLQLLSVGNVHNVIGLAGILGCGVVSLSLKYLGLLFGASYKTKHIWDDVLEKIEPQLTS